MDDDVTPEQVRGMVGDLRPDWTVRGFERAEEGTDFVAFVDVTTPNGRRDVVLKATTAGFVPPEAARAEPRLLRQVSQETSVPVPEVYGYRDAHGAYPAPYYLLEHVDGENFEGRADELPTEARRRIAADAGRNLAEVHALGTLPAYGHLGVENGELAVLDTDDYPRHDEFRGFLRNGVEDALDVLETGGYFPELADDEERFADLVPALRSYVETTVPELPPADPPAVSHWDYRYGNLLVDPETGETNAVLDWAHLTAADPAHTLAKVEAHLVPPGAGVHPKEGAPGAALQRALRDGYAERRDGWAFNEAVRERMRFYRLTARLDAMACLPLWHEDGSAEDRDDVERRHREFVARYL